MNNTLKILGITIIAVFILFTGLTILSSLKPTEKTSENPLPKMPTAIPTPTLSPVETSPILFQLTPTISSTAGDFLQIKKSLIQKMPYENNLFLIEYLYTSDSFIVTIKESPFEQNVQKAELWFKEQGITNLRDLDITYNKYRWVE